MFKIGDIVKFGEQLWEVEGFEKDGRVNIVLNGRNEGVVFTTHFCANPERLSKIEDYKEDQTD